MAMYEGSVKDKKIIYAWDNRESVFLLFREDGKKQVAEISDFEWYFCIEEVELTKATPVLKKYKDLQIVKKLTRRNDGYIRVYLKKDGSNQVSEFFNDLKKDGITCLEKDLSLSKRYVIDSNVQLEENLKIGYFDIETDDTHGEIIIGGYPMLSWSIVGDDGAVHYEKSESKDEEDEKVLLLKFFKAMDKYDLIVGWNSSNFDIPYIKARAEYIDSILGTNLRFHKEDGVDVWRRTMRVDLMMRYVKLFAPIMSILGLTSFRLEEFGQVFLKRGKTPHTEKIHELFEHNPEKLKEYNVNDCRLVKDINEHNTTLALMIKECVWTGSFIDKFYVGELLDNYLLREAKKKGKYLLSRPASGCYKCDEERGIEHEIHGRNRTELCEQCLNKANFIRGGYVKEPEIGFYDNVRVFDFKSMYPTIIIGHNIGEETLKKDTADETSKNFARFLGHISVEKIDFDSWMSFLKVQKRIYDPKDEHYQTASNQFFRKSVKSLLSEQIASLLQQRKQYKKAMDSYKEGTTEYANARASQEVVKELANSCFGVTADAKSRYYNPHISESITLTGQFWNRMSSKLFKEKFGLTTLYADTDSVFTVIDDDELAEKYHEGINEQLNIAVKELFHLNPEKDLIDLEYEKKYSRLILLDKKRYIGRLVWSNGKTVSFIHSRGTENVKKDTVPFTKKVLLEMVEKIIEGMTVEDAKTWLSSLLELVKTKSFSADEVKMTQKISKPIADYKTENFLIKLAKRKIAEKKEQDLKIATKISEGARISYIVVDNDNKETGAVFPEEYTGEIDRIYYWNVKIYAPLKRILSVVYAGVDWESYMLITKKKIAMIERKKVSEEKKRLILEKKEAKRLEKEAIARRQPSLFG